MCVIRWACCLGQFLRRCKIPVPKALLSLLQFVAHGCKLCILSRIASLFALFHIESKPNSIIGSPRSGPPDQALYENVCSRQHDAPIDIIYSVLICLQAP